MSPNQGNAPLVVSACEVNADQITRMPTPTRNALNAIAFLLCRIGGGESGTEFGKLPWLMLPIVQLGVPTELFTYRGNTARNPDPRNQLLKAVNEMAGMDYYVRGTGKKCSWRDMLKTLEGEKDAPKVKTTTDSSPP